MNVSDSEVVRTLLYEDGLREAESAATADIVLLNTCAIREKAEQKVWTRLRDLRRKGVKGQTGGRARLHGGARQRRLV